MSFVPPPVDADIYRVAQNRDPVQRLVEPGFVNLLQIFVPDPYKPLLSTFAHLCVPYQKRAVYPPICIRTVAKMSWRLDVLEQFAVPPDLVEPERMRKVDALLRTTCSLNVTGLHEPVKLVGNGGYCSDLWLGSRINLHKTSKRYRRRKTKNDFHLRKTPTE